MTLEEIIAALTGAPGPARQEALAKAARLKARYRWMPNPGPQTEAYFCDADELLFGGEVGGGKSDMGLGLAINDHTRSLILRRVQTDAADLAERFCEILGSRRGYSSNPPTYMAADKLVEFRGCENEKDKHRFKGKPHDFIYWDELSDFLESQYVFVNQWNRSAKKGQRCRIVAGTNGPTKVEGQWILRRWAPWLDPSHPNPAQSGEIRWYITTAAGEQEVDGPGPHQVDGPDKPPRRALSRCFIRSFLSDNPDLARTDYADRLAGAPDELRRVYGKGDFTVSLEDGAFQVIPTAWIEAAMERWTPQIPRGARMTAMAVDVSQGGPDLSVIAPRYDGWYAELVCIPGAECRDANHVAGHIVQHRRNNCPVVVDLGGGWGGDVLKRLTENGIPTYPFMGVLPSAGRSRNGKYKFANKRAEGYWRFREELDPNQEGGSTVALPHDPIMKADLAAARFTIGKQGIQLEPKEKIKERIGRSPDRGDAVVMCGSEGDKAVRSMQREALNGYDRQTSADVGYAEHKQAAGGR